LIIAQRADLAEEMGAAERWRITLSCVMRTQRHRPRLSALVLLALSAVCGALPACETVDRGVVIAHRGASGYLPEHTIEAYSLGYEMGADFLEPDLVMCRDGHLICSHDLSVTGRSDAADLYPERADEEGVVRIRDLSLAELRRVRFTDADGAGSYRYATFSELLDLARSFFGREVGVAPELKSPEWHRAEGLPMERRLIEQLTKAGYRAATELVIIQCFERESLYRLKVELGSPFPQVLCLGGESTAADLNWAAEFCEGVAPPRAAIEDPETGEVSGLVEGAHRLGLSVYPYTFGDEEEAMRRYLYEHGVEGLFTDFPDKGVAARADD